MKKVKTKPASRAPTRRKEKKSSVATGKVSGQKALQPADVVPGEVLLGEGDIVAFAGRATVKLSVANAGDRPIQVGSHCHFFEANRALRFEREKAFGCRLQIPAGTAVRFEPGEEKEVILVAIGGNRVVFGINALTSGHLDDPQVKAAALARAKEQGFIEEG